MFQEFKSFALRGNVLDLAVGVIIGGAFGKIVSSLVQDVIMPPIGFLVGGVNFTDLKIVLKNASVESDVISINYGNFLQSTFDFLIISFAIFMMIKLLSAARIKTENKALKQVAKNSAEVKLLEEIRDLLKKEN
jgi:large conductance mechanosensitive channel